MKRKKIHWRSPCPVACTLDILGDRWTLLVIRDLFCGKSSFSEFSRSPEGIATNILADRLERLVDWQLIERHSPGEIQGKGAYRLTEKGKSLRPILEAVAAWGLDNIPGTAKKLTPVD